MIEEKPLFDSLEQTVRWMCLTAPHTNETVHGPAFARWQKTSEREQLSDEKPKAPRYSDLAGKPKGLDAAGQMGMFGAFFNSLPPEQYYHILAKFLTPGPKPKKESRTFDDDEAQRLAIIETRRNAREFLAMLMQAEHGKDIDLRVFVQLVQKFYGERVSVAKLAKQAGMTRYRMRALDVSVYVSMDALSVRAERVVYSRFTASGVVA